MKGFTLIESVVVIAILAILALVSVNNIVEFQRNAILTSAAQELVSTIRVARQNSMSGLVKPGETYDTSGYPYYGVYIYYNTTDKMYEYHLQRTYTLTAGSPTTESIEQIDHKIDSSVSLSSAPMTITFSRITGDPGSAQSLTLTRVGTSVSKTITVNTNGLVSL